MTEQERHLGILKIMGGLVLAVLVIIGSLLYYGKELPFYDMRINHTDATGYVNPPRSYYRLGSSVPRDSGNPPTHATVLPPPLPPPPAGKVGGHAAVPAQAEGLVNPLAGNAAAAMAGKKLYEINCAQCHGKNGEGDGPAGHSYIPTPPDLRQHAGMHSPGHLYYLITYGIRSTPDAFGARYLPDQWHAFWQVTSEQERWQLVTFMKSPLFARPMGGMP